MALAGLAPACQDQPEPAPAPANRVSGMITQQEPAPAPDPAPAPQSSEPVMEMEMETRPEPARGPAPAPAPEVRAGYAIHISSFRKPENAEAEARNLAAKVEYPVFTQQAVVDSKTWRRVLIGPFAEKEQARTLAQRLKNQKIIKDYFILRLGG